MPKLGSSSRPFRSFLLLVACFAGLSRLTQGQTAPSLLPYTAKLIAGGGTAVVGTGATCPVSGYKSTDAYGDGCLATEIELGNTAAGVNTPGARSAVADSSGNVFFTDYNNGLVRRVDAVTGIVTAVAGGASSNPGTGATCGTNLSIDAIGDGCLGTAVKLTHPASIVFSPTGDLYFGDPGAGQVRKIAATGGAITTTGVITLVAGNVGGTYGYFASNATTTVVAATQSYLRAPYGLAFDTKGDLFIVDEYTEAILVVNTNATGTNTVNTVPVAAGTIWKIAGTTTGTTAPYCVNGTASGYGCSYGLYTENIQANTDSFDSTYSLAVGPDGTVYAGNEYYDSVFKVSPAGVLSTFAGKQNNVGVKPTIGNRGPAGSFGVGSIFGTAVDANSNVYFTDASSGAIWRVDGAGLSQYVVAGGATTVCSSATDTYGDGCPATQATLGHSGSGNYATATLPGPGVYGVSVDSNSDLFFGDTETNLVREIASGTQFGTVGAGQPTQTVDIHFTEADGPLSSGAYTLTTGATNFSLGTASCKTNSDNTTDCLLPITATPTVLGPFSGTLTVMSVLGGTGNFSLNGIYVQSPVTRTTVSYAAGVTCAGTTTYATTAPITITATLVANGPSNPTGTVTFLANGTAIGTPQTVTNIGTTSSPVYGATLTYTFSTIGTYTLSATYSGDTYFKTSTGTSSKTITTTTPAFTTSVVTSGTATNPNCPTGVPGNVSQCVISAGQTALYSFTVGQSVYAGTLSFACSGLPQYSSCSFSPPTVVANGCSTTSVIALSIITQQAATVLPVSLGGSGRGLVALFSMLLGVALAAFIGIRRRRVPMRFGQLWLALAMLLAASGTLACGNVSQGGPATPSGTYSVTVTTTGTTGTPSTFTVPLVVK